MRKILLALTAAVAVLSVADRADAMTLTAPNGLRVAIDSTNLAEEARWVCRYRWDGRRTCWWQPTYYRPPYRRYRRW